MALDESNLEDDYLLVPSCIESLVNSAEQLQQLALYIDKHYIKLLLTYGYTYESTLDLSSIFPNLKLDDINASQLKSQREYNLSKLLQDQQVLGSLHSTLKCLPLLEELSSFIERCFTTIELTLKRSTYHLNKVNDGASQNPKLNDRDSRSISVEEFHLNEQAKLHCTLISLMDVLYALVSLDKTIQAHTNIRSGLQFFKSICQIIVETKSGKPSNPFGARDDLGDFGIGDVSSDELNRLVEFVDSIQLTLFKDKLSLYELCLDHFQYLGLILSKDKTRNGFKNLALQFENFLVSYSDLILADQEMTTCNKSSKSLAEQNLYLLDLIVSPSLYMNSTTRRAFGILSIYRLYQCIFKSKSENRIMRSVCLMLQKVRTSNLLHLIGTNSYLLLSDFIAIHLPNIGSKVIQRLNDQSDLITKQLDLTREFERETMRVVPWQMELKATFNFAYGDGNSIDLFRRQLSVFEFGLKLADEINETIKISTSAHLHSGKSMTKQDLIPSLRLVPLLKSIESNLKEYKSSLDDLAIQVENVVRSRWRKTLTSIRKRLISARYSDRRLNTQTTLLLTSLCNRVDYLDNPHGRRVMTMCLSMLVPSLSREENQNLNSLLSLCTFDRLDSECKGVTNCGHLYWSYQTFDVYYTNAFERDPCALDELRYFQLALDDLVQVFESDKNLEFTWSKTGGDYSWFDETRNNFIDKLKLELVDQFKVEFLDRICQEFEIELRLQTHRDLHLDGHNPFRRHLFNFKRIFASRRPVSFKIMDQIIELQYYVESHLNRVCYNLTAIAPHDWFAYDSMLNLARHKHQLRFCSSQLPAHTLDSGLDLLYIIRNLPLFVSRYGYDLINQLFIEKSTNRLSSSASIFSAVGGASLMSSYASSSSNQSLNVIQIRHIASSIQTHGFGLLNSAVNCTYQTMKRLINVLSKQLRDDKLQTTLSKELQHYNIILESTKQQQQQQQQTKGKESVMTYDRANKLAKKFRLNVSQMSNDSSQQSSSQIDLDSIRQTITQLGNLLAFIRSLKSGALSCASKSADYIPDLDSLTLGSRWAKYVDEEFGATLTDESDHRILKKAAENLDRCLGDCGENFSPRTNYFNIIIGLFTTILTSSSSDGEAQTPSKNKSTVDYSGTESNGPQANRSSPASTLQSESELESATSSSERSDRSDQIDRAGKQQVGDTAKQSNKPKGPIKSNNHLRLFYLLVPSLTINYIDYLINCKERLSSRSAAARFGALISDDGFSMGCAFLLTVLKQTRDLARLEWFRQVRCKLAEDRQEIERRMRDSRYEESLRLTSSVTLKRLARLESEYTGLDYTISSALLFLRSTTLER